MSLQTHSLGISLVGGRAGRLPEGVCQLPPSLSPLSPLPILACSIMVALSPYLPLPPLQEHGAGVEGALDPWGLSYNGGVSCHTARD